jgi:hypothetical protein
MSNGTERLEASVNPANKRQGITRRLLRVARSVAAIVMFAFVIGWILNRIAGSLERSSRPAGFVRGLVQGALMPMSLPNLLVGKDITIYAVNNTGVHYKLGYTAGTNTAGLIFFGAFFWRVRRWRSESRPS